MTNFRIDSVQFKALPVKANKAKPFQIITAEILNKDVGDIVSLTKDKSKKRLDFLSILTDIYNANNFYRKPSEKEESSLVEHIFTTIKNPKNIHRYIVKHFSDSLEEMSRIFDASKNNSKRLKFAQKVNEEIFELKKPKGNTLVRELLESEYSRDYVRNFKGIKSYLILNKDNSKAVEQLDKEFKNKTFDSKFYDKKLQEENIKNEFYLDGTEILNKEVYLKLYTPYAHSFMENFESKTMLDKQNVLDNNNDKYLLQILKTLNSDNVALRTKLLNYDMNQKLMHLKVSKQTFNLEELQKLYSTIDNDKNARKFIEKTLDNISTSVSIAELNEILAKMPTKQLNIFHKNAFNIINQTAPNERIEVLKQNIENPFYLNSNFVSIMRVNPMKNLSHTKKMLMQISNLMNKIRMNFN